MRVPQPSIIDNELSCGSAVAAVSPPQDEYWRRGFQEVSSPNIYNSKLWETSGHWQHYSDNMFSFPVEEDVFALKPMNCPGHWYLLPPPHKL